MFAKQTVVGLAEQTSTLAMMSNTCKKILPVVHIIDLCIISENHFIL